MGEGTAAGEGSAGGRWDMGLSKVLDHIVVAYVRWRLASFGKHGDAGDRLGDALVKLLSREIERRNQELVGWDGELKAEQARAAEGFQRAIITEIFEKLNSSAGWFRQ